MSVQVRIRDRFPGDSTPCLQMRRQSSPLPKQTETFPSPVVGLANRSELNASGTAADDTIQPLALVLAETGIDPYFLLKSQRVSTCHSSHSGQSRERLYDIHLEPHLYLIPLFVQRVASTIFTFGNLFSEVFFVTC